MDKKNATQIQAPLSAGHPCEQLGHDEQLEMAASYIEIAMQRLLVCAAALRNASASDADTRLAMAYMLGKETHNELDVAREIFVTWKAQEAANV